MAEPQRRQLSCAYCRWDRRPRHTIECCLHKPGCCVCGQAHKGRDCDHLPEGMKAAQQALRCARAQKAGANRALHIALAEQKRQVDAAAQRAACTALHAAFSVWRAAAKPAPVANEGAACAVVDGSSAVAGTSSATAGDTVTSAAADAEPAGTDSADDAGAAGGSSVAIGDASPAASAVSEGGAAPATRCCTHALTSFWAPQKWQCSTCVCVVPVGACMQHCAQCGLDYCTDCRPAGAEQAAARLRFQPKERRAACEAVLEHECALPPLIGNRKTPGCSMFWWGHPCRNQLTRLCHYLPEVPSPTKANANMANPMQSKWVCDTCYTRTPNQSWEPLQLKEFREMQAAFTLPRPMLPSTTANTRSVKPAERDVQLASAKPGAVVPGAEGLHNLLPHTGQHVAGLCDQAMANCARVVFDKNGNLIKELLPFERVCVQYRCVECSRSVDVAHNFGEHTPQEHRTGDSIYAPCNGTLLLYAMPKLLHDATDFSLLLPGVELNMATLCVNMAYYMRVDEREVSTRVSEVVEGTWLGDELLAWTAKQRLTGQTGTQFQVHVFKASVDPNTPSDGTKPTRPDKEQLRLEALHAARSPGCRLCVLLASPCVLGMMRL